MGGNLDNPSYPQVKTGATKVTLKPLKFCSTRKKVSYEQILKLYFETHDFTQIGGQGPDIGSQYRSVIFYSNEEQKTTAENLIELLTRMGNKVATSLEPASTFWKAEDYHQHYYDKNGDSPYCHIYKKIFK